MTTVTAIVPTFNRADVLSRALASIFSQSRVPDEVIVVDDGSSDDTQAVLRQFPQARVLRLERNQGAAGARNAGVGAASGELIAFLDSDDAWAPGKLRRQLDTFEVSRPDLLCTGITVHARDGTATVHPGCGPGSRRGWSFADFQAYPFAPSTWLIRRAVFAEEGAFDESLPNCEDLDYLARISHRRIEVLPDVLAIKFNRADSLDAAPERTAHSYGVLLSRHQELWTRAPRTAARNFRHLAHLHFQAERAGDARRALRAAVGRWPWDVKAWAWLALSTLGATVCNALRRRRVP